jgi:hypothetical protein
VVNNRLLGGGVLLLVNRSGLLGSYLLGFSSSINMGFTLVVSRLLLVVKRLLVVNSSGLGLGSRSRRRGLGLLSRLMVLFMLLSVGGLLLSSSRSFITLVHIVAVVSLSLRSLSSGGRSRSRLFGSLGQRLLLVVLLGRRNLLFATLMHVIVVVSLSLRSLSNGSGRGDGFLLQGGSLGQRLLVIRVLRLKLKLRLFSTLINGTILYLFVIRLSSKANECEIMQSNIYLDTDGITNLEIVTVKLAVQFFVPLLNISLRVVILQGNSIAILTGNDYIKVSIISIL